MKKYQFKNDKHILLSGCPLTIFLIDSGTNPSSCSLHYNMKTVLIPKYPKANVQNQKSQQHLTFNIFIDNCFLIRRWKSGQKKIAKTDKQVLWLLTSYSKIFQIFTIENNNKTFSRSLKIFKSDFLPGNPFPL